MRFLVFWVLFAPVALVSGVACGSEQSKRPEGPAPVYEPWVLPTWAVSSSGSTPGDALDALIDDAPAAESATPLATASSTGSNSALQPLSEATSAPTGASTSAIVTAR